MCVLWVRGDGRVTVQANETVAGWLLPMYYYVPKDLIELERSLGNQERLPSPEGSTDGIFLWGQAVYLISQMLCEYNTIKRVQ